MMPRDDPDAPDWWRGEDEASASFLRAVGAQIGPDGEVVR